jgi:hypothetical protein
MSALRDPTVLFTVSVVLLPVIYTGSMQGALIYLTTPMLIMSLVFLVLVVKLTEHPKGSCVDPLPAHEQRMAYWFLMNGVYFNLFLDVVSGQFQMMDEMSRQYLKVEPRYALGPFDVHGQSVFWTSMCELFFQSPLCLMTYFAYRRNAPWRRPVEMIASLLHVAGVWFFYVPEAFAGFPHLGGWPKSTQEALSMDRLVFFWFGFWFCGILWSVMPVMVLVRNVREIAEFVEEASSKAVNGENGRRRAGKKSKSPAGR